jgi:hypothetical protein
LYDLQRGAILRRVPRRYAVRKTQIVHRRRAHRRRKRCNPIARWEARVLMLMQDARQPELRLWASVMWEAIRDLGRPTASAAYCDAWRWAVCLPRTPQPMGSFIWLCEELDLDPDTVREALIGPPAAAHAAA